ncbi:uncharacterized protein LOC125491473 [Plutella xylostella]|uniref:uncharacterized protein LOC125491473 n=1 Tax=Plutella xylostella TaxID=51655 RepID=UPI002032AC44|nr:uncharacterized protein LOC125491473 [Plutella xylostella]
MVRAKTKGGERVTRDQRHRNHGAYLCQRESIRQRFRNKTNKNSFKKPFPKCVHSIILRSGRRVAGTTKKGTYPVTRLKLTGALGTKFTWIYLLEMEKSIDGDKSVQFPKFLR